MAKKNIQILGAMAPLLLGAAAFAYATKKTPTKTAAPSGPIVLKCSPPSIQIKDDPKANQLLVDIAKAYIATLKNVNELSYISLLGDTIKKISPSCYTLYVAQKFESKDLIFILAYLSISVQNAFKIAYFGDIINLKADEITPEIKEDWDVWQNFETKINPEKIAEIQKYIGFSAEMNNDLQKIIEIIKVNDKYPA